MIINNIIELIIIPNRRFLQMPFTKPIKERIIDGTNGIQAALGAKARSISAKNPGQNNSPKEITPNTIEAIPFFLSSLLKLCTSYKYFFLISSVRINDG